MSVSFDMVTSPRLRLDRHYGVMPCSQRFWIEYTDLDLEGRIKITNFAV